MRIADVRPAINMICVEAKAAPAADAHVVGGLTTSMPL
jgi:hypothetical protein